MVINGGKNRTTPCAIHDKEIFVADRDHEAVVTPATPSLVTECECVRGDKEETENKRRKLQEKLGNLGERDGMEGEERGKWLERNR